MNIFHHHLEAVEASGLRDLNFSHESLSKVLKNDAVRGCKEGQYILNEMLLVVAEGGPVTQVTAKINLVDSPEASHLVFVHLPNVVVLDR